MGRDSSLRKEDQEGSIQKPRRWRQGLRFTMPREHVHWVSSHTQDSGDKEEYGQCGPVVEVRVLFPVRT